MLRLLIGRFDLRPVGNAITVVVVFDFFLERVTRSELTDDIAGKALDDDSILGPGRGGCAVRVRDQYRQP